MTTYLAQLDPYLYTKVYKYVWDAVMHELITDHGHVSTYIDNLYSTSCRHGLYRYMNDEEWLTKRLFRFYIIQIHNGKLRRGSDHFKNLFSINLNDLSRLTILHNDPAIHQSPLYQTQFGTVFRERDGSPPPVVGYLIQTILTTKDVP
jgi:hypothetical protein